MARLRRSAPPPAPSPTAPVDESDPAATTPPSATEVQYGARFRIGRDEYLVLSVPLPTLRLPAALTAAERAVVEAVFEGRSNDEIARQRDTSPHTIANQLATAFRKLGVGSRTELIARFGRDED
jgi:DNA-binding NarL/FixJ family response regulator